MSSEYDHFYASTSPPEHYDSSLDKARLWIEEHCLQQRKIAFITSGGTTVPLERNTVRFVDNFSQGTRGAASCEHFIRNGYAVLFLHRDNSVMPFTRHIKGQYILEALVAQTSGGKESAQCTIDLQSLQLDNIVSVYRRVSSQNSLLTIPFSSLADYLWLLKGFTCLLQEKTSSTVPALLYLAAAVADFYIPNDNLPEHKIQSKDGPISVELQTVPKMLFPLCKDWGRDLFVVSFKLETDFSQLNKKAIGALKRYGHQLVVGNILQTRRSEVTLIESIRDSESGVEEYANLLLSLSLNTSEHKEIEEMIVENIQRRHQKFISNRQGH